MAFYLTYVRVQACPTACGVGDIATASVPGRREGEEDKEEEEEKEKKSCTFVNLGTLTWQVGNKLRD